MVVPFLDRVGGYEKQALGLSRRLITEGVSPFIVTENFRGLPSFEIRDGVAINRLNPLYPIDPFHSGLNFTRYDPALFFLNRLKDIHVIHCHAWSPLSGQMIKLGRKFGIRSIIKVATEKDVETFHKPREHALREHLVFPSEHEKEKWIRDIQRAFQEILRSDYFVSLNNNITRELIHIGISPKQILSISNGVDCDTFSPLVDGGQRPILREQLGLTNKKTVTFVGRLVERKRCDDLIKAFAMISGEFPDVNLVLVGDGEERSKLEELSEDLNLSDRIQFLGERDEVVDILRVSDLFVFPSRLEGNPNALLEAMATQLPIAATYLTGHVEFLSHGENAFLTPVKAPSLLGEAMRFLLNHPDIALRLAENARKTVLEHMSFDVLSKRYVELYEAIIKGSVDIHHFSNYKNYFKGDGISQSKNIRLMDPDIFHKKHMALEKSRVEEKRDVELHTTSCTLCDGYEHEVVDQNNCRLINGLKIVRCKDCGHVFLNPRIKRGEDIHSTTLDYLKRCYLKEYTRLKCLDSEKVLLSTKNYRYYLPFLEEISPFRVNNRLLDYGCAIGLFLLAAKQDGWEGYGLEMSEMLVRYGQVNFNLDIGCGLIEGCAFPPSFFDAITMIEVLEHVFNPFTTLEKTYSLLREGGIVLITTPNFNSLERILAGREWEVFVSDHQHYFTIDRLKNLVEKNRFKVIKIQTQAVNLHEYNARFGYERVKEAVEQNGITSDNIDLFFGTTIFCLAQKSEGFKVTV
jgi:glycosyltransferase involved in cell wall biosynthesis/2-polyprenyl-3-methyl-5-hydroxy-6-metoxy-1,4-benzoquinol methylase